MFRSIFVSLAALLALSPDLSAAEISSVTIPVAEYMTLKKQSEMPSLTTVDEVAFTGNYGKELSVTIAGASVGTPKPVDVLSFTAQNISLRDCSGNAVLGTDGNSISVLPTASRFKLNCRVSVKNWATAQVNVLNTLFVRSDVLGSEPTIESASFARRTVSFVRASKLAEPLVVGEVTTFGRYRMAVMPEGTNFSYSIEITNPGRGKTPFDIRWPNEEMVQSIRTTMEYEEKPGVLKLSLSPGTNTLMVVGKFRGNNFKAPLEKGQQYAMVENHPMLQVSLQSPGRRIASSDSGMSPVFNSARAYLLEKGQTITWETKKLEVFATTGYSVPQANYTYFIPEKGEGLVEAQFQIDNQGTPEIPLEVPGTAVYLEVDRVPQVLSKDSENRLLLQLSQGTHNVLVQYKTKDSFSGWLAPVRLGFARPDALISNASVRVGFLNPVSVLYAKGFNQMLSDFKSREFFAAFFSFLAFFFALGAFGAGKFTRTAFAGGFAFLHLLNPWWLNTTLFCLFCVGCIRYRRPIFAFFARNFGTIQKPDWKRVVLGTFCVFAALFLYKFFLTGNYSRYEMQAERANFDGANMLAQSMPQSGGASRARSGRGGAPGAMSKVAAMEMEEGGVMADGAMAEDQAVQMMEAAAPAAPAPQMSADNYQGLPARVAAPHSQRFIYLSQGLVDEKTQLMLQGLFVQRRYLDIFQFAFLLGVCFWAVRTREKILYFLKAREIA